MAISNQCKNCGSRLSFDAKTQKLQCSHCNTELDIPAPSAVNEKYIFNETSTERLSKQKNEQFKCNNCGNVHIIMGESTSLVCPACGSRDFTKMVEVNVEPDGIIPFKIDKNDASSYFSKWLKKRWLAPNNLKKLAKLKKLTGAYFPIWNYNFTDTFSYSGVGITTYKTKDGKVRESSHPFSDTIVTNQQDFFVNANDKIHNKTLRELNDYNMTDMHIFSPEYMYGWVGIEKNIGVQDSFSILKNTVYQERDTAIKNELNFRYNRLRNYRSDIFYSNVSYNYIYLPIWVNHYSYKNKDYNCYINGVTGHTVGKSPISFIKAFFLGLGIALILAILYFLSNL